MILEFIKASLVCEAFVYMPGMAQLFPELVL